MKKQNTLVITILVVIIVGAGGFFAGMKYQQGQRGQFGGRMMGGNQQGNNNNGNRMGFRPVNGDIIASDDKSITVKASDGSSKIVLVSQTTTINKAAIATKDDLKVGEKVAVFGQTNSDGSVTAQNIQLNPIQRNLPDGNQPKQ
jgi:hypothetical protein